MRLLWLVVVVAAGLSACRAHPKPGRRILVDDTPQAQECFEFAQAAYRDCLYMRGRRGLCESNRVKALMQCPGARDVTGEPDPTVVQLPGYRP
jgi:hypothetical protein